MKELLGVDTETAKGQAVIIAHQNQWRQVSGFLDCVRFLLAPRISLAFAYNLDFDFRAIIKSLGARVAEQLYLHKKIDITVDGICVKIEYIPNKFCSFAIGGHKINLYDAWQYFGMSLDAAGAKYLNNVKIEVPHDKLTHLEDFVDDKATMQEFGAYCQHDAKLVHDLAVYLLTSLESCGIDARKFYSTGYLAKRVLKKHHRCYALPSNIERFVRATFHGGRIEVLRRGAIDKLWVYDINSAYPAVISQLLDTCSAQYHLSDTINASTYFVYGKLWLKAGQPFYPIPYKNHGKDLTVYPHMEGVDVCITSIEHQCLLKHNLIERFDIDTVLNVEYTSDLKPYAFVSDYYQKRQEGDMQKLVYKLILNSLYGIFCERSKGYRQISPGERFRMYKQDVNASRVAQVLDIFHAHPDYWFCDCQACAQAISTMRLMRLRVKPVRGSIETQAGTFIRGNRRGKYSNMLNASIITASVRCQVFDFAMQNPLDVISFATDSVTMASPVNIPVSKEMGQISLQKIGENGVYIGSGVYEFTDAQTNEVYTRFRGFDTRLHLRDLLTQFATGKTLDVPATQVVSIGTMIHSQHITDHYLLNEFLDIIKVLDINFDRKRIWLDNFENCAGVLNASIPSIPLTVRGNRV